MRHVAQHLRLILTSILTLTVLYVLPVSTSAAAGNIRYVSPGGTGDCTSWGTACELQDALAQAVGQDEIWVAQGTYYPDQGSGQTDNAPTSTFTLPADVALYGGFNGSETSRDQRDWTVNRTILSGDLEQNDPSDNGVVTDPNQITGTNAYHVVRSSGVTSSTVLDGFIVTAGSASGSGYDAVGGGMCNENDSPTVKNITFTGNRADGSYHSSGGSNSGGGGMYNLNASPMLYNVTFSNNSAYAWAGNGGGMYNENSNPTLNNVTFSDNNAINYGMGGGMFNEYSSPTLSNVTFSRNSAGWEGGGIANGMSNPTLNNTTFNGNSAGFSSGGIFNANGGSIINNSILWGDTEPEVGDAASVSTITSSLIQGSGGSGNWNTAFGTDGGGNLDADPRFVDPATGNVRLQRDSPAVDVGNDAFNTASTDLDGNPRLVDGNGDGVATIDMGAYEYQHINLVTNGSFEEPVVESGFNTYYAGQTFGGWTVESGSVDLTTDWAAADGRQALELSGDDAGTIYQDLATQSGTGYQLDFSLAGDPDIPNMMQMEVWWGTTLVDTLTFDTTGRSRQDMGWGRHSYTVTASDSTTRLTFKSLTAGIWGPALDAVFVTPYTPPPTYAITGRVTDANGNPLADVALNDGAGHSAITGADGSYSFTGLSEGYYTLTATRVGYTFDPVARGFSLPPDIGGQDFVATPTQMPLTATSGYTSIPLTWGVAPDPYVTSYQISRVVGAPDAAFSPIATTTDPFYVDSTALTSGTTYCYQVAAIRGDGQVAATSNTACAYVGQVDLWVPDTWGAPGSTVLVPVNVRNADGLRIAAADLWLDFDGSILEPVGVSPSALTADYTWTYAVQDSGATQRLKIAAVSTNAPTLRGAGSLFWVAFRVRGDADSSSPLNLRKFISGVGGSSMQDPTYANIPLNLKSGVFQVGTAYILGDLSGDGLVQALDALMALDIASGKLTPTSAQRQAGDTNGDGVIGAADATMILYYATHSAWPSLAPTVAATVPGAPRLTAGNPRIRLDSVTATPGQTVELTLRGENLPNVAGGEFSIVYDRALITGIDTVATTGLASGFPVSAYDDGAGRLRIAIAGSHAVSGSDVLITLRLHLAANAPLGSVTPLNLASAQLNDLQGRDFTALGLTVERQSGTLRTQSLVYLPVVVR